MPLTGIDVSHIQGDMDWTAVAQAGYTFAYAKATEGLTIADAKFAANWAGMGSANLFRGAYHYFHPNDDAAAQATQFLTALTEANGSAKLAPGDLPCALDVEVNGGLSPADLVTSIQVWLDAVQTATGRVPIIYTGPGFWNTATAGTTQFAQYPLWVAEYGVSAPKNPSGWNDYTIWQWSEAQTIAEVGGLSVTVDADRFNGAITDLEKLAGGV